MCPETLLDLLEPTAVSPYKEMISFELLYSQDDATLKRVTDKTVRAGLLPSQAAKSEYGMVAPSQLDDIERMVNRKIGNLSVAVNNTPTWPRKLRDSARPTPLFYYYGDIGLMESKSISVVGSRKASEGGLKRAAKMGRLLAENEITVVSGLAKGIDTAAMTAAMEHGGKLIGVIGTPIDECYPKENRALQTAVANDHLLVSQVPFYRYANQPFSTRRYYFPERNELMAAISDATVIIEASDTSGTLTQARACMHQKRKLFILKSCYDDLSVSWPKKWAQRDNVYVVDSVEAILDITYGEKK